MRTARQISKTCPQLRRLNNVHWKDRIKAQQARGADEALESFAAHAVAKGMGFAVKDIAEVLKAEQCFVFDDTEAAKVQLLYRHWWGLTKKPFKRRDLVILPAGTDDKGTEALDIIDRGLTIAKTPDQGPFVVGRVKGTDTVLTWAYLDIVTAHPWLVPPYLTLERAADTRFVLIKQGTVRFFEQFNDHDARTLPAG